MNCADLFVFVAFSYTVLLNAATNSRFAPTISHFSLPAWPAPQKHSHPFCACIPSLPSLPF